MVRLLITLLLVFATSVSAEDIRGTVISVHDGDTYTMKTTDGRILKVRQLGIDAPELSQTFGNVSADFNFYLLDGREVVVHSPKTDLYGRILGQTNVHIGDNWYSAEQIMLINGMAWHYKQYHKSDDYDALEKKARANRWGLWKDSNPVPPWQFRRDKKETSKSK